jgi:F420-dependent oxidoreductase-like protein
MRFGYSVGSLGGSLSAADHAELAVEAERLGYDSAWAAEIFGTDPIGLLAWLAAKTTRIGLGTAVLQISSRSAVTTAITAATLQQLSGGRFRLGLGVSGPQVVEGWHGVSYDRPLLRLRDYSAVLHLALAGQPVAYTGATVTLPLAGSQGQAIAVTGLTRPSVLPLYLAAIGPKAIGLAGELADGWIAINCPPRYVAEGWKLLRAGATRSGRQLDEFDAAVLVHLLIEDDLELARDMMRPSLAMYLGGMGSREKNFYNRLAARLGFEDTATRLQDFYLSGDLDKAMAVLPDEVIDEMTICGPAERVTKRLAAYRDAGTTTVIAGIVGATRAQRHEQLCRFADAARSLA